MPRFFDLYEMPIDTFKATLIYKDETGLDFGDISNDKKFIAFQKNGASQADSDVYLYNTATKEMKNITPHTGEVANSPQAFDANSKYLYYLSDAGSEFSYVARYDLGDRQERDSRESAVGRLLHLLLAQRKISRHRSQRRRAHEDQDLRSQRPASSIPLPQLPNGDITGVNISPSEKLMAFYLNGDRSPSNLYVYDFATKKATKLTDSLNPEINADDLVESQVIRYKSFDGMEIPSILYKPKQASAQTKAPAVLLIHGGPGGQTRVGYSAVDAVPRQSWLRRARSQQSRFEWLWQDVLRR